MGAQADSKHVPRSGRKKKFLPFNMDNWSNQDDFRSFEDYVGRLKDMFYKRITPPAHYLQSIVDELEG